jgi:L-serine/L-threonine ammonia-lyase
MELHVETPLLRSPYYSSLLGRTVLMKLENLQPSNSFKIRGVGYMMLKVGRQAPALPALLHSPSHTGA